MNLKEVYMLLDDVQREEADLGDRPMEAKNYLENFVASVRRLVVQLDDVEMKRETWAAIHDVEQYIKY